MQLCAEIVLGNKLWALGGLNQKSKTNTRPDKQTESIADNNDS